MLIKTKSQNERMIFKKSYPLPSRKENLKNVLIW